MLPLAREIDTLLDARERQVEKARARAADLAHGLKTPLQLLSSDAERLKAKGEDELAEEIEDIAGSMRRHVERELARARSGANAANASASVAAVAATRRARDRAHAARKARHLDGRRAGRASWRVSTRKISPKPSATSPRMRRGTRTRRSHVRARAEEGVVVLAVIDDGPGIPPERAQEALRRGGRLDQSGSAGLGLAIVGDIADAWGASLSIEAPAHGCRIVLRIPGASVRSRLASGRCNFRGARRVRMWTPRFAPPQERQCRPSS